MCRGTHFEAQNLGGCATLLLSWAYYRIGVCRPQGDFDELRFPLIERWRSYVVRTDSLGPRVRMWRIYLNGVDHAGVNWTPYADPNLEAIVPPDVIAFHPSWALVCPLLCFAIVEWH
ncbi:hypothetical protein PIB30_043835 [Stylosanthes scabra]|uniref:Aminotransferase-like plant mobile domain-containing protein n=1 Tax=Stylosanthes scabra TaxID=79078 RepID=A0ABU6WHP1_9FABA|nr:hypothetical protein [Stylosanthes scabra]